jgi:hypothetical protein
MLNQRMKPGHSRGLLLAAVLASTLTGLGLDADAALACKTKAQKSSKACAHAVHRKPPSNGKSESIGQFTAAKPVVAVAAPSADNPMPTSPCFAALAASQAARHIAVKVPLFVGQVPGPETLANASRPSKKEHEELSSLIAGYQMCQEMSASALEASEASQQPPLDDAQWHASKSILEALQAGKMSYGAAAAALVEAGTRN